MSAAVAPARRPASPYARRLARENGLALAMIAGTGPGGRIVAADIEAFLARCALEPASLPVAAAPAASAFSIAVELAAATLLLADLERAGAPVTIETLLVRAAALALEAIPAARQGAAGLAVALERGGGEARRLITVSDPHLGRIGALQERLAADAEPPDGARPAEPGSAALSVRCLTIAGVRPLGMPLLREIPARLVLSKPEDGKPAEALLSFDAARLGEDAAAALLGRVRDGLEKPLRLLA